MLKVFLSQKIGVKSQCHAVIMPSCHAVMLSLCHNVIVSYTPHTIKHPILLNKGGILLNIPFY